MRVLLFASSYAPRTGGLETVTRLLVRELRTAGHEVTVATNRYPRRLPSRAVIDSVQVYRQTYPDILSGAGGRGLRHQLQWLASLPLLPLAVLRLLLLMRREKPDVVNVHYLSYPAIYAMTAARILRIPIVLSFHGSDVPIDANGRVARLFTSWANAYTAPSHHLASRLTRILSPDRNQLVTVIPNGIDITEEAVPPTGVARCSVTAQPTDRILLLPARLVDTKGVDVAIRSMALLREQGHSIRLLLAGDGPCRHEYEALARSLSLEDRITFLGSIPHERVQVLMREAFLVLVPSLMEGFGMVALEAMAAGTCVIASDIGGIPEVVVDGETGLLTEPGEPLSLAACIDRAVRDPEEAARLGERGHARALAGFLPPAMMNGYLRAYESGIAHARKHNGRDTDRTWNCVILAYHEIAPIDAGMRRSLVVSPETFARHLRVVRAMGNRFVSLDAVAGALAGGPPLPPKSVAVTFDDGYTGIHRYALPILERFHCPATVFVPSALVGQRGENGAQPPVDKMSLAELRDLVGAGHCIGAHSRTHPDLRALCDADLDCEVAGSKRDLERLLGAEVTVFCYPYGGFDERVRGAAHDAGYTLACTTTRGSVSSNTEPLSLPRLVVGSDVPAWQLLLRLSRAATWS